jgi:glycosyltransferase involved in cell wall biosynthesis
MTPLVSVLIAAHNEAGHLGECLTSLLAQTHSPIEVLVLDDGSSDGTADLAERLTGIRVFRLPHRGKAVTVNFGAAEARGEILLFLDGDMYFEPGYVERLIAPIVAGRAVGTCHGTELVANPRNRWAACWQAKAGLPFDVRLRLTEAQIAEGSEVYRAVRREAFLAVGGFDDVGYTDDRTLAPKLGAPAMFVPDAVCYHYNVESAREVFALGAWAGKSLAPRARLRTVAGLVPPVCVFRALRSAARVGRASIVAYDFLYDLGRAWGVTRYRLGGDRSYGR